MSGPIGLQSAESTSFYKKFTKFGKTESAITMQRAFRIKFSCQPPNDNNILRWYHQFETIGCLCKGKKSEPNNFIRQQDSAPPYWHLSVRDWLNITVPNQWIGRKEPPDKACIAWPPRSSDLTPCNFYLYGLITDCVYVLLLPVDLPDLIHWIEEAVARIS
ncbi:uncharacterized protein TNCV_3905461 [Trichonephila clavipes]|nr:uncharacterized protein TNCV_3905461 [Trichonephila clavipes]